MTNYPYPTINDLAFVAYSGARIVFGGLYVTGQPSTEAYPAMAAPPPDGAGIKSVICVRSPSETKPSSPPYPPVPPFDTQEKDILARLGVSYTNDFVIERGMPQPDFDRIATRAALQMLHDQEGMRPALIHCSTGDRASSVFAVLLILVFGASNQDVIDYCTNCLLLANSQVIASVRNYRVPVSTAADAEAAKGKLLGRA
jgi:protein tyrosine phosphatase (PTP) superfamily phosphohydrolase (DUF442 family)